MIYADQRWIGPHGIGRFARHVLAGLDYRPVLLTSHPAAPLDAWRLAGALGKLTRKDLFFSPGYNTPLFCASPFCVKRQSSNGQRQILPLIVRVI
jgi:hypothetical protein